MANYSEESLAKIARIGQVEVHNREVIPNLKAQRNELQNRINKIDLLLSMFEKNPEFIKMLDLTRELI